MGTASSDCRLCDAVLETLNRLPTTEEANAFLCRVRSNGEHSIGEVYAGGVRNVLAALPSDVGRFIYISTTGVYGNAHGDWIDEVTPPDPQREGGRAFARSGSRHLGKSVCRSQCCVAARGHLRAGADSVSGPAAGRGADPGGEYRASQSDPCGRCGGGGCGGGERNKAPVIR